ncbi:hypothetical protein Harman_00180 [Haloarcula mannanilytica]|uniref:Uncharacterized protein n=1 Tax=Haloarcula mannanilytica TaxID=2509225 RepID=A0A4C2EHJ0_9EURY|nr:hypothetical protein Harman_00180 [Haloarcula mannanilytica]
MLGVEIRKVRIPIRVLVVVVSLELVRDSFQSYFAGRVRIVCLDVDSPVLAFVSDKPTLFESAKRRSDAPTGNVQFLSKLTRTEPEFGVAG